MKQIFTYLIVFAGVASPAFAQTECAADSAEARNLREVVVNGDMPRIAGEAGVLTVDLPEMVKDKPVTNILEALAFLPGVTDNNGQIWLAGATNVSIIINGEPTNMPLSNLYQMLYAMPVDRLRKVEIMYAAPAKYHVNGALINVVLKTPRPLDGLQGQLRVGYNRAHYDSYGSALAATYAVKDWSFDLNYGLTRAKEWTREESFSNHPFGDRRVMIENESRGTSRALRNSIYASAAWKALKVTYNGQILSGVSKQSRTTGTSGDFNNDYSYDKPIGFHNIAVRYAAPFGLTVGVDYTRYSERRRQVLSAAGEPLLSSLSSQAVNRYHLYVDNQHQTGAWQLNYGVEYQQSDDSSWQAYAGESNKGFSGTAHEYVADAYVGTAAAFDMGLSFNLSLKGEYYRSAYTSNWNCMPQLSATYSKTRTSIFQINLTSQRVYPSYWEIHGGTAHIDGYSVIEGNSHLLPQIDYSSQLSYIFRQKYVATLYVQYVDKASVQLPYQQPGELKLVFRTVNMNYKRVAGLSLHVPFEVGEVWSATASANVFHQRERADSFHDIGFDNARWIVYGALSNTLRLGRNSPVALTVNAACISPSIQGIADLSALWKVDAGVKWRFGRKRSCEAVLTASDVFNTWSPEMTIRRGGQDYRMRVRDMSRALKLTFIWRFNGFEPKSSGVDTSRFGTGK